MTPTQFRDRNGKSWDVRLTLGKALRVDRSDFSNYTESKIWLSKYDRDSVTLLLTDNALMFAVIGVIVRDQAYENLGLPKEKVDTEFDEKFVEGIDGSCLEPAREAMVESLGDFFPAAKIALSTFLKKLRGYQTTTMEKMTELLPLMDKKVNAMIDNEFAKIRDELNETSSPLLPPSDSTEVSGNSLPSESLSSDMTPGKLNAGGPLLC